MAEMSFSRDEGIQLVSESNEGWYEAVFCATRRGTSRGFISTCNSFIMAGLLGPGNFDHSTYAGGPPIQGLEPIGT